MATTSFSAVAVVLALVLLLPNGARGDPDTPYPDGPQTSARSGPRCPAYSDVDDSYASTLRKHGPGDAQCTAPAHAATSLPFRSPLVAPAFCAQPPERHGHAADACAMWAKTNYYPLTEENVRAISGPGGKWRGDRTRLRAAVRAAMSGKPLRVQVYGCSFSEGRGCPPRWLNGTRYGRRQWSQRLESLLKWMFPQSPSVEVAFIPDAGGTSFTVLRNLPKTTPPEATASDVYIVDYSPNDFSPNAKGKGIAGITALIAQKLLALKHAPALLYLETWGYKSMPFCDFEHIERCDADFEHGFKQHLECLGHEGCDFGDWDMTGEGCKAPCKGTVKWAPPHGLWEHSPDKKNFDMASVVPYPVPAKIGDLRAEVRKPFVEWWSSHMYRGRDTRHRDRNWACDPGAAAGNLHMAALEHYHVPVVSMQDATCDFDKCGPLSPQRYPLWPKWDAHTDCLPTHQIVADLIAGIFAAEALAECGLEMASDSEDGPAAGNQSTAAALAREGPASGVATGLETCDAPLVNIDAHEAAKSGGGTAVEKITLGSQWRFEEDAKDKFGWIYLADRRPPGGASASSRRLARPGGHRALDEPLEVELQITKGIVVVEFMRSYEGFGDAVCTFQLVEPAAAFNAKTEASKHRRPQPRVLNGSWDALVSMTDHESFSGFWPPGKWSLRIEPSSTCKKFKFLGVESC